MIKILVKPQINTTELSVFDATEDYVIKFIANTGDQVLANEIEIQKTIDNTQVYANKINSMYLNHIIPANTLQNGGVYRIHLRTYNNQDQYSSWSDWVVLTCFSKPIIDISNIMNNSILNNQNYSFMGSYNQTEEDKLQYYKFILYDYNENIVSESPIIFSQNDIQYKFSGMANNQKYFIELQTTTQHNITVSIKKSFTTAYIAPMFTNYITLTNNKENASVDIQVIAIRTLGHISSGNVVIEDGEWANCIVENGIIQFDDQNNNGLYFEYSQGNWQLQLWLKGLVDDYVPINNVLEGTSIVLLYGNNAFCKIQYYDGCFHFYKYIMINNSYQIISHYASNIINATPNDVVYLFVQSTNDRIELTSEIIE